IAVVAANPRVDSAASRSWPQSTAFKSSLHRLQLFCPQASTLLSTSFPRRSGDGTALHTTNAIPRRADLEDTAQEDPVDTAGVAVAQAPQRHGGHPERGRGDQGPGPGGNLQLRPGRDTADARMRRGLVHVRGELEPVLHQAVLEDEERSRHLVVGREVDVAGLGEPPQRDEPADDGTGLLTHRVENPPDFPDVLRWQRADRPDSDRDTLARPADAVPYQERPAPN